MGLLPWPRAPYGHFLFLCRPAPLTFVASLRTTANWGRGAQMLHSIQLLTLPTPRVSACPCKALCEPAAWLQFSLSS